MFNLQINLENTAILSQSPNMGFLSAGLSSSVKVLYFRKLSPKHFIYLLVVEIQLLIGVSIALPVTLLNSCINIFFLWIP